MLISYIMILLSSISYTTPEHSESSQVMLIISHINNMIIAILLFSNYLLSICLTTKKHNLPQLHLCNEQRYGHPLWYHLTRQFKVHNWTNFTASALREQLNINIYGLLFKSETQTNPSEAKITTMNSGRALAKRTEFSPSIESSFSNDQSTL